MLVYQANSRSGEDFIFTTEKPDDVDKPIGYIEYVGDAQVFRRFSHPGNKDVYLNPFTNRWE